MRAGRWCALALLLSGAAVRAASGDLDATFGDSGRARIDLPSHGAIVTATLQPDGKVIAVGSAEYPGPSQSILVARLGLDGRPDPTFSGDGFATVNVSTAAATFGSAVTITPDNKILVAGTAYITGSNFRLVPVIARFLADGSPDASFGTNGIRTYDADFVHSYDISAIVLLPDGRVVIGGNTFNGQGTGDYFFMRTTAEGVPDTSFGTGGFTTLDFSQTGDQLDGLVRLPDGKLLAVGISMTSTGFSITSVRMSANGQLDAAGDGGKFRIGIAQSDHTRSIAQQADGKVLIAGTSSPPNSFDSVIGFVARLDTRGVLDTSFGSHGRIIRGDPIYAVTSRPDGRIFFAGREQREFGPYGVGRGFAQAVRSDGSADPDFAPSGRARIDFGSGANWSHFDSFAMLAMSDGRFVVLGNPEENQLVATRLLSTGGHPGVLSLWRSNPQYFGAAYMNESDGSTEFTVERTGGSAGAVSVNYGATSATAIAGRDFTATSGTLTWGDGETAAKKILLPLLDDNDYEPTDDVIDMTLSSPTGGALLGSSQLSTTTTSDEGIAQLTAHGQRILESEGTALVRIERRGDTRLRSTADYRITDGTATAGVNYSGASSGTLVWESGDVSDRFITLALIDSPVSQGGTVNVTLSNPSPGTQFLFDNTTVEIIDDDGPQGTSYAGRLFHYVSESAGTVSVSVGRPGGDPAQPASMDLHAESFDPSVIDGVDFGPPGVTHLDWTVGDYSRRTVTVPILADNRFELTECFSLYEGLGGTIAVICILDDDPNPGMPGASFASAEVHVKEGVGIARIQVNRTGDSSGLTRVAIGTSSMTLRTPEDYPGPPSNPIFSTVLAWQPDDTAPQFVEFPLTDDDVPEPDEYVDLYMRDYPYEQPFSGAHHLIRLVIDNDDGPFVQRVGFTQAAISVSEDAEYVDIPIKRSGMSADATVTYSLRAGSTADAGTEFVMPREPRAIQFTDSTPVDWSQDLRIYLNGDQRGEGDETFTVDLAGVDGLMPVGQSSITVTLVSSDVTVPPVPIQVGFANTSVTQAENQATVNLTVSRTGPVTGALSVHYETVPGTALAGSDFTAATGDVSWAAGDGADKTLSVTLLDDTAVETAESFGVRLSAPTNGATLASDTATITINSEDVAPPGGGGSSSGGGGSVGGGSKGGGGRLDALMLMMLSLACVAIVMRRRQSAARGACR